jgi:hypothetical protein
MAFGPFIYDMDKTKGLDIHGFGDVRRPIHPEAYTLTKHYSLDYSLSIPVYVHSRSTLINSTRVFPKSPVSVLAQLLSLSSSTMSQK